MPLTVEEIIEKWQRERKADAERELALEAWRYKPGRRWLMWAPRAWLWGGANWKKHGRYRQLAYRGHVTRTGQRLATFRNA